MNAKSIFLVVIVVVLLGGGVWWSNSIAENDPSVVSRDGMHWHPELEIYLQGEKVIVPANIGLIGGHNSMHTHEEDGVVHLEYDGLVREDDTRLEKFFALWGKEFGSEQIFEYQNGSDGEVHMYVNGEESVEFGNYLMRDGDKIEIRYE